MLGGNNQTTPGAQFVGTTDNQALEFKVNSGRALRLEPNATSPNLIGGWQGNSVGGGAAGAVISGGGGSGSANAANGNYSAIGGGAGNVIDSGGAEATIAGGATNHIQTGADTSAIGGGYGNSISCRGSTIAGGWQNVALACFGSIGGGTRNWIQGGSYCTIAGGYGNAALNSWDYETIGGGAYNTNAAPYSTVPGGFQKRVIERQRVRLMAPTGIKINEVSGYSR